MEVDREKLNSLTTIFGRDIPVHIISEALLKHKNNLDETVNYLLERNPESMIQPPPQQQPPQPQQPQPQKDQADLKALQNMFGNDLTQSVIATVLHSNSGDVSNAVDELLTITSKELQPPQPVPARDLDQTRRMQREIQEMEEFKKLQQRMQEEELRLAEETRRVAEQRVRERENRAAEEQMRRAAEEKRAAELLKQEQARMQAELAIKEQQRQEAFAAEIRLQEELAAIRISEQMVVIDEEKKKIELQRKKMMQEQELREQEEASRRKSLEVEEKRRRDAIQEEERAIKRRLEEEEIATKRRLEEEEFTRRRALEERDFQQRRAVEQERAKYEAETHRIAAERARLALQEEATLREKERLQQVALEEEEKRKQDDIQRSKRLKEEHLRMKEEIRRQFMEDEERRQAQEEERKRKLAEDQFDESVVILPAVSAAGVELQCDVKDDVISVTWNLPTSVATPSDWIGVHSVHNNKKYEQYFKTGGSDAGSHDFKGLTPGYHTVNFYPKGTWTPAFTSAPIRIGNEAVVTVKVEGDQIRINYTPSPTPARDWVGIYESTQRNKNYLFTTYGNATGELIVTAPRPVGSYEARVFYAGSDYNEQCTTVFNIADNDRISCNPTTVEQGATLRAEWVMRTKEPSSYNWIGLFRTDEKDNTKYIVSTYISSATVGGSDIVVPKDLAAGCYELRLFVNAVGKYETYKTSNMFNVVAPPPSK